MRGDEGWREESRCHERVTTIKGGETGECGEVVARGSALTVEATWKWRPWRLTYELGLEDTGEMEGLGHRLNAKAYVQIYGEDGEDDMGRGRA